MDTLLANDYLARLITLITVPMIVAALVVTIAVVTGLAGRVALVVEDRTYARRPVGPMARARRAG